MSSGAFPFDAVLFDLDGTLVSTEDYWIPAASRAARRAFDELALGRPVPGRAEWMRMVGLPFDEGLRRLFSDLTDTQRARLRALCTEEEERALARDGASARPGAVEALAELAAAGVRLGIASNCGAGYLERVTASLGLERWVAERRCLDSPGVADKGDMLADLLVTFDTRSAVMVGDRVVDQRAARANGLPSVHVRSGYGGDGAEEEGADLVLDDLGGLCDALRARTRFLETAAAELGVRGAGVRAVGVTGRRASGKSLFARDLARVAGEGGTAARVVALDAFRKDRVSGVDGGDPLAGFDVERLVEECLEPHARGEAGRIPAHEGDGGTVAADELLVLEGPFLLDPRVATRLSRLVYLSLPDELRFERVAGREGRLAGPGPVARVRSDDLEVEARFERRFAPERADLVLDGSALPREPSAEGPTTGGA